MALKYLVYGIVVCSFVSCANHRGWRPFNDLFFARTWDPKGPSGMSHK